MPTQATEFFGIDFGSKPVQTQAAPAPATTPPATEDKGVVHNALSFFGLDFAAKPTPPPVQQQPQVDLTSGSWADINQKYKATQGAREATRLDLLNTELANEKDPKRIEILKREVARAIKEKTNG